MSAENQPADEQNTPPEEENLLDHQYDGIQEFDNPMPRWWVWIFWGSFWFSLAYVFHFWVGNGQSIASGYDAEMKEVSAARAAEALKQEVSEETLTQLLGDSARIGRGKDTFAQKCAACHLEQGQGSIGPNLTDKHWIHGTGRLMDIYQAVSEGFPAKGMPAWNRQLTPQELREVVAFVGSIRGLAVPGKAPEGTEVP